METMFIALIVSGSSDEAAAHNAPIDADQSYAKRSLGGVGERQKQRFVKMSPLLLRKACIACRSDDATQRGYEAAATSKIRSAKPAVF
jgi:hypothetical protein